MNMKKTNEDEKQPIRYWSVELTLTSDEVLKFYVKALDEFEAYKKADGYSMWVSNEKLLNHLRGFKLMV